MMGRRNFFLATLFIWLSATACANQRFTQHIQALPTGAWEATTGHQKIRFEPDRLVVAEDRNLKAMRILERAPGTLIVRDQGIKEAWTISQDGKILTLRHNAETKTYRPLPDAPPELDLTPIPLGDAGKLSPQEIREIQAEILRRRDRDQAVRKDPKLKGNWEAVDAENFAYLKALVRHVGWIDSEHFGKPAAAAAIVIAKHSADPRLMQAILSSVERDVERSSVSAELYSILYDELRLSMGYKQRYGTQLDEDPAGPYVLPLEEPEKVDDLRKKIGLQPLAEYLATASKYLYEDKPIRILSEEH